MNDIMKEILPGHKGEVCVIFLSLHRICGPAVILPNSTCRECLTSKERLPSDSVSDFSQAPLAVRLGIAIQNNHQKTPQKPFWGHLVQPVSFDWATRISTTLLLMALTVETHKSASPKI